ncbi:hypothetical protein [Brumimicrobium mesophilum]|uniref:hypothetical protein n=1 Tax=Brumimicrobium mesophilum TaxID=392717 RepID=UPI000D143050|nr:hypothetical protein [Brumimicrobium mesophilum]
MQKYKRVIGFAVVLLFLVGLWIIIGFINFSNSKQGQSNTSKIPNEVEFVIQLNTREIIKVFLKDLLFNAEIDNSTAELFMPKEKGEASKLGIDLSSEVIAFYDEWNSTTAKGVLFNLSDEADFKRYQFDFENLIKASNPQYGVLLLLDKDANQANKIYYQKLAEKIVHAEGKSNHTSDPKNMIQISHHKGETKYDVGINTIGDILKIEGSGTVGHFNKAIEMHQFKALDSSYFEIQTGKLNLYSFEFLQPLMNEIGLKIPTILSQQLAIQGITIQKVGSSTLPIPALDWIVKFNEKVNIDSLLFHLNSRYSTAIDFKNQHFNIGELQFNYKQLSSSEIYIGVNNLTFERLNKTPQFALKGNPEAILNIQGNNFFAGFIKMLPQVKYPKTFLEDIEHFNIHSEQEGELMKIKGEIKMKEGKYISVEMAKLVMLLL